MRATRCEHELRKSVSWKIQEASRSKWDERERKKWHTASAPCLFFHPIHLENLLASSSATGSHVSTAK